ncbi:MAG: glycosyltransferase family 1 protein [Candidatus Woesebacteria bacterium]|jgi:glycosyltransferase involved in cell wall biosynthesis
MSDNNPKIYFDVTQLVHWAGKLAGIPRVMHELAVRFEKDSNVVFVSWVKELQSLCEVDLERSMANRGHGVIYKRYGQKPSEDIVVLKKTLLRRGVVKVAKIALRHGAKINPELANRVENNLRQSHFADVKRVEFEKGDKLFIPWGEWWDSNFTAYLVGMHQKGVKLVQIIHDIGTTVCPQFYEQVKVSPTTYNSQIVPVCDLVLTVSKNTKKELIQWLKESDLNVPKIESFRLGDDLNVAKPMSPIDPAFKESGLKGGDYIICIGTLEAKKNHMLFYYVYKLAKARGIKLPKLVIVGRRGWMSDATRTLMTEDPEVKECFILLHNTSDEELSWLYDHCMFTVLPSFHEGWGIPIAESLGRGVPCACANTSSMVEIAEGLVEHFSPASSDECLAVIQKLIKPSELSATRKKVKEYKQFTWDESANQVKSILKDI